MASLSQARHGRPSLGVIVGVFVGVFGLVVALAVTNGQRGAGGGTTVDTTEPSSAQKALLAYEAAVTPATREAGEAIVLGIRPDISELRAGRISASVWQADMAARAKQFAHARTAFATAYAPSLLGDAPMRFDQALSTYLLAARTLYEAGNVTGNARLALISMGADLGDEGDALFDRGAAHIQAARRAFGLGPDVNFPDPGPTP
ncbi:MAG: hypothetical protein ACYDH6_19815 [Acidimicrobiales bacterium]